MLAFGVSTGVTPTGQSTYVIDNGADLTFSVINGGTLSSTIHLADISSIQYRSQELLAPYSASSRYSHYEQGLSSLTDISYTIGGDNEWILVTCDDSTYGVIQYYAVRNGDNNLYMASDVNAGGEGRFIAYLSRDVFTNIEEPSDISGNVGAVEGSDVFYMADGTTRSKFYNDRRMVENEYHGVTGAVGRLHVGAWMFMGNREHSAGGPFFKDIDFQTTSGATEIYNVLFSGHTQTEPYRYGLQGPYALQITDGSAPTTPDYSWMETLGIQDWIPASQRGSISGIASGMVSGHQTVVGLSNSDAQYWAIADLVTGAYSIDGVQAGTYTMTMYDQELEVGTRAVTIDAQANLVVDITNTYYTPDAIWRIGTWDGTPAGFLNADKISLMHPSDVRMDPWVDSNFVVGANTDADWPMAQFMDVNNGQRITFSLTAAQATAAQTLRIGITLGFEGGRNRITVNAGTASEWTSSIPAASVDLNSRGITRGTYRGPNQLYTYNIPASALVAGANTIDLPVVSGSSGTGFLSPNVVYDAIDLVPTASLTSAPYVQTITLTPASSTIGLGGEIDFTALAKDQFGNPIAANIEFSTTGGNIDQQGHFTAQLATGVDTITASSGVVTATATVLVVGPTPYVVDPADATPNPSYNATVDLSVLGGDDGGESNLTYTWTVLGTPLGSVSFSANGTNVAKNTTVTLGEQGSYDLRVTIADLAGNTATSDVTVSHRQFIAWYEADETSGATLADSSGGGNDANLLGSYSFDTGRFRGAVDFTGGYATLPAGIVSKLTDFTITTWVNLSSVSDWARIFDFGTGTTANMFLTPSNGANGYLRFAITTGGGSGEQQINSTYAFPTGVWTQVAVVLQGTVGVLYVNGGEVGRNSSMTLTPSSLGNTTQNYIGKSQYADPYLDGRVDDFRILSRALSSREVAAMANPPDLFGDYNRDNAVDAADYTVWRDTLGATVPAYVGADGDGDGLIGQGDYLVWKAHYGETYQAPAAALSALAEPMEESAEKPTEEPTDSAFALYAPTTESAAPTLNAIESAEPTEPTVANRDAELLLLVRQVTSMRQGRSTHVPEVRQDVTIEDLDVAFADVLPKAGRMGGIEARVHDVLIGLRN